MNLLIPLTPVPQTFQIGLNGVNYLLTIKWNDSVDGGWEFELSDSDTNTVILSGAPLVTGVNLLSGLDYLGIGGAMYAYADGNPEAVPTYENLGVESNLYFVTP